MQGYGRLVKISTSCVDKSCVMEESRRPMERTLDAWMPRRPGVVVKNKFRALQMGAVDDDEEEDIATVNYEANDGVASATVDNGAARSVWPKRKGVLRTKLDKKPKLAAANGTKIEVYVEAVLELEETGKHCGMRCLDSDVKKLLAAVSAMNDEGNTVVISKKWESYIENDTIGEKIMIERVGDTFEMTLKAKKMRDGTLKELRWAEDGGEKYEGNEVDANDEQEDMLKEIASGKSGSVVFRRQMS